MSFETKATSYWTVVGTGGRTMFNGNNRGRIDVIPHGTAKNIGGLSSPSTFLPEIMQLRGHEYNKEG
jgi:hypothetical protein